MPLELDHLSYSSISTYLMCPRSWRFRYVDHIETPKAAALVFGSAIHDTIEAFIARGKDEPVATLERWQGNWEKQTAAGNIDWGEAGKPDTLYSLGQTMLSEPSIVETLSEIRPLIERDQTWIEARVKLCVPSVPVPIVGYIDCITADGVPCDFKTAGRAWSADQAAGEMQPLFYLAALNQVGFYRKPGRPVGAFRHYVLVKNAKSPRCDVFDTQRTMGEVLWLFGLVRDVWRGIEAGVFPPNPETWKCSAKWCEFWDRCRGKV
jgi:hypothetical protein